MRMNRIQDAIHGASEEGRVPSTLVFRSTVQEVPREMMGLKVEVNHNVPQDQVLLLDDRRNLISVIDLSKDLVVLQFKNRTARTENSFTVEREACASICDWYGGFHAGDKYTVRVDGTIQKLGVNGEIKAPPTTSAPRPTLYGKSR